MIVEKCRKKLGWGRHAPDEWSPDDAVWHISHGNGYTLCGCKVGSESKGWFVLQGYSDREVSCLRCQAAQHRMQRTGARLPAKNRSSEVEYTGIRIVLD